MERYVDKLAVVTGASSGIGWEITKELVKRGVIVVGLARRVERLQELANEVLSDKNTYKGKFYFRECDLTDMVQIKKTFEWIKSQLGAVSIMINNAGVYISSSLLDITEDNYDKVFNTNVKSAVMCTREALYSMVENNIAGHVININSVLGLHGQLTSIRDNTFVLYSASKHALRAFSTGLKLELTSKNHNIKVTNISPGLTDTDMPRSFNTQMLDENSILQASDVAKACIAVLDTSPNCNISELTIKPLHSL